MEDIVVKVRNYVLNHCNHSFIHGIAHWDRVYQNGQELLTPEVNPLVVSLFAYLHDSCRLDDGSDLEHGPRAAKWIEDLRTNLLADLTDEEFGLLRQACKYHTTRRRMNNPTIDACFDADRLDIGRVGLTPLPEKMATPQGARLAMMGK